VATKGKKENVVWVCPKCGSRKNVDSDEKVVIPLKVQEPKPFKEPIAVIGREEQKLRTLPTVRVECPKCGNNIDLFDRHTGRQINRCDNCNTKFKLNRERKIFTALIFFFLLTFFSWLL